MAYFLIFTIYIPYIHTMILWHLFSAKKEHLVLTPGGSLHLRSVRSQGGHCRIFVFFAPNPCEKNGVGSQQLSKKGVGIVGRNVLASTGSVLAWLQALPCDPNQ